MIKYQISWSETTDKIVQVKATSEEEARKKFEDNEYLDIEEVIDVDFIEGSLNIDEVEE